MGHPIDFETFNNMFKISSCSKSNLIWNCQKKNVFPGKQAGSIYSNGYWCLRLRFNKNEPSWLIISAVYDALVPAPLGSAT